MGSFTYAVYQMPPGKHYMAEGTTCSWTDWVRTLSEVTGKSISYRQVTPEEMISIVGDDDLGLEVAYMFSYTSDPGYDGAMDLLKAEDIRKVLSCLLLHWNRSRLDSNMTDWMAGWHRVPHDIVEGVG